MIPKLQNLFGWNLFVAPYFYLKPFTKGTFNKEVFKKND